MIPAPTARARVWWTIAAALTIGKLWLTRGQGVYAIGSAGHDDRLFLELAQHLVRGEWLGPYNELTLAKGPGYPGFIALAFVVGVPLFLAQQLLYAGACALFARALRPALPAGARCLAYLLLLWNPMSFDAPAMGRVLRQHIYGPLALIAIASLVALCLRRDRPRRAQLPWAAALGVAGAGLYLTREEMAWILPGLGLLAATAVVNARRIASAAARRMLASLAAAAAIGALPVLFVSVQNQRHYGWFGTCEMRSPEFRAAYGAMLRVKLGPGLPFVPVTREARTALAAASPAFADLQRQFEGGVAQGWAASSEFLTRIPADQGQIGGGWLVWAVRDAAARAGHHGSAADARRFYGNLAREINAACDSGRLPSGPPRNGFLPPWRGEWSGAFWHATATFTDFVARFSRFSARPPPSSGSVAELQLFHAMTREGLSPADGTEAIDAGQYRLLPARVDQLQTIGKALRPVLLALVLTAHALALVRLAQLLWQRRWTVPFSVALAAWSAVAASIAMHAIIEATSFPVLTISSFAPIYPLLLVFVIAVAWDTWSDRKNFAVARGVAPLPTARGAVAFHGAGWREGAAVALLALVPFVVWQGQFRQLFWFADDLFLIDQIAEMGFWTWAGQVFSENFVPFFKVLWGGAALGSGGSYAIMLWLLWLTHALNGVVFHAVLRRAGLATGAALGATAVFVLTPANVETLGWSVQWSAVLATTFLLAGLWWTQRAEGKAGFDWRRDLPLTLFAALSACSFSRGVLTGPILGLALALPAIESRRWRDLMRRVPSVVLIVLPAVLVAGIIGRASQGNHQHLGGHGGEVAEFALAYFLFNPGDATLGLPPHAVTFAALGAAKLLFLGAGLWFASGRARLLLVILLAFDLGNALLIGVGRYHTGFLAALSSRYQYGSLLATLPAVWVVCSALAGRLSRRARLGPRLELVLAAVAIVACLRGWPATLKEFTGWRGTELRALLAAPPTADPAAKVPALEFMHVERGKALVRAFRLH